MSRRVKKGFTDRLNGYAYQPGDLYSGTDERLTELENSGHLTKTDVPLTSDEGGEHAEPSKPARRKHADPGPDSNG